jgi:lipopolysaccharide export LptBFGC system permease protein LptF
MAISWFSVLKMVPWGDVIENAPKVAQGARGLWNTVSKKTDAKAAGLGASAEAEGSQPALSLPELQSQLRAVQSQLAALQTQNAELHEQMQACARLIASLADQNTQLVNRVALHRRVGFVLMVLVLGLVAASIVARL